MRRCLSKAIAALQATAQLTTEVVYEETELSLLADGEIGVDALQRILLHLDPAQLQGIELFHHVGQLLIGGAIAKTLADGIRTPDIGGSASTAQVGDAILGVLAGA